MEEFKNIWGRGEIGIILQGIEYGVVSCIPEGFGFPWATKAKLVKASVSATEFEMIYFAIRSEGKEWVRQPQKN